jgi:chemotaxis protein MotB
MIDEEEEDVCECPSGIPAWVMTFADLMSLLMCFFVLLLSFAEMDALKFKRLAGELRQAFGVQVDVRADSTPKGTSVIAKHFSPAIPEPTPINEVRQKTSDLSQSSLEVLCQDEVTQQQERQGDEGQKTREIVVPKESAAEKKAEETAVEVAAKLETEVSSGKIEVETQGKKIIIRIQDNSAFKSGSDYIDDKFLPVIDKIREVLVSIPGRISVEGHTDDIPAQSGRFRSNWALSSARAAAFSEELFIAPEMRQERFQVIGHGSVRPLVANTDAESRSRNRRVEIIILQTTEDDDDNKPFIDNPDKAINDALKAKPEDFALDPNDIF